MHSNIYLITITEIYVKNDRIDGQPCTSKVYKLYTLKRKYMFIYIYIYTHV